MLQNDTLGVNFPGRPYSRLRDFYPADRRTVRVSAAFAMAVFMLVAMVGFGALLLLIRAANPVEFEAVSQIVG